MAYFGRVSGQRHPAPRFRFRPGYARGMFHLQLRLSAFGARSIHLACKVGHKIKTVNHITLLVVINKYINHNNNNNNNNNSVSLIKRLYCRYKYLED